MRKLGIVRASETSKPALIDTPPPTRPKHVYAHSDPSHQLLFPHLSASSLRKWDLLEQSNHTCQCPQLHTLHIQSAPSPQHPHLQLWCPWSRWRVRLFLSYWKPRRISLLHFSSPWTPFVSQNCLLPSDLPQWGNMEQLVPLCILEDENVPWS